MRTSLRTLSDCHRYSVAACSITRLYAPLLAVAAPLSGHSCGVDLGRFPRSLSVQLRRRHAALPAPSCWEAVPAFPWLGSESHLMRCKLWSALQQKSPQVLTPQVATWRPFKGSESGPEGSASSMWRHQQCGLYSSFLQAVNKHTAHVVRAATLKR